jgi:hypothetical protein
MRTDGPVCQQCGYTYVPRRDADRFCSQLCWRTWSKAHPGEQHRPTKIQACDDPAEATIRTAQMEILERWLDLGPAERSARRAYVRQREQVTALMSQRIRAWVAA